jgi:hypothetical protein
MRRGCRAGDDAIGEGRDYLAEERRIAKAIQRQGGIAPKVQAVMDVLRECARKDVPKSFAYGILLIFIELIRGVPLGLAGSSGDTCDKTNS